MNSKELRIAGKVSWAKRKALGRFLCRLMGDRQGAVMMEYVILSVLVAAAVVVAVIYFGRTIMMQFNSASAATAGQTKDSLKLSKKAVLEAKKGEAVGDAMNKQYHDMK